MVKFILTSTNFKGKTTNPDLGLHFTHPTLDIEYYIATNNLFFGELTVVENSISFNFPRHKPNLYYKYLINQQINLEQQRLILRKNVIQDHALNQLYRISKTDQNK